MKKLLPLIGFLMTSVPAEDLEVTLAAWPGNAKAAWTCTFDDAIRDQYTFAAPLLKKYDLPATYFVLGWTAKSVEEAEKKKKGSWGGITWEEMKLLIADGHEIGNHSWSHHDLRRVPQEKWDKEILRAQESIARNTGVTPTTFCFPFNGMNQELIENVQETHEAWRTNYRQFGGGVRAEKAAAWLDEEETRGGWTVLMVHGLLKGYDAFKDPSQFEAHLREVTKRAQAGDLWAATFRDVAAYKKMRESAGLTVVSESAQSLKMKLTSSLDVEKQTPLTLVLTRISHKTTR